MPESIMPVLRALTDAETPHRTYVLRAWLIAVLPSLALFGARVLAGNASLGGPAGPGAVGFAAYSILAAPVIETAAMLPLALALRHLAGASDWPRVLALAILAALAHAFTGTAWAGVSAFWPFVVYSAALFAWLRRAWGEAFVVVAAIHMLYNATIFAVGLGLARLAGV